MLKARVIRAAEPPRERPRINLKFGELVLGGVGFGGLVLDVPLHCPKQVVQLVGTRLSAIGGNLLLASPNLLLQYSTDRYDYMDV
jgi:hypothetical protein